MATHTIVPKGSLDPDDIRLDPANPPDGYLVEADYKIDLNDFPFSSGDTFRIRGDVSDNITFEDGGGGTKTANIEFDGDSTAGGYSVTVKDGINANFTVGAGRDISDVDFSLNNAGDVSLIGGAGVEIGNYSGSNTGDDTIWLGAGSTVNGNIDTRSDGFADITLGNGSTITGDVIVGDDGSEIDLGTTDVGGKITTGDGVDEITVGGTVSGDVDTGAGADDLTLEDDARLDGKLTTGDGNDEIVAGDDVRFNGTVDLGNGNDSLTAGDHAIFGGTGVKLGAGDDTVDVGDDAMFLVQITGADGDDDVTIGDSAAITDGIDLGNDDDTLTIGENAEITGKDIALGNGNNTLTIGDGYDLNGQKITAGDGNDNVDLGDVATNNTDALDLDTGKGDDTVRIGNLDQNLANKIVVGGTKDSDNLYLEVKDAGDRAALEAALAAEGYTKSGQTWTSDEISGGGAKETVTWGNTEIQNAEYIHVVCFTRGTRIATDQGEVAIEDLAEGDRVLTMDHGLQPIRWIGSSRVKAQGRLAPIKIAAGALGNTRDLLVSPQHRMMLSGWQMELLFAEPEVLAPAVSLVNDTTIRRQTGGEVEYFHMLFDDHEIVFAEGAPSESFHPGRQGMGSFAEATREEIFTLFPELREDADNYGPAARMSLKTHEVQVAMQALDAERAATHAETGHAAVA